LLVFFHGIAVPILTAYYYRYGDRLWNARLYLDDGTESIFPARGAALLLPWNLLPHDVAWLAADVLVFGTLTICLTYWIVGDELKSQLVGREQAAADKLKEADQRSKEADTRSKSAEAREQAARAAERKAEERELMATNREAEAQAHIEAKDIEVDKMSRALARLKQQNKDMRKGR
jgi:hypothetical protein